MPPNVDSRVGSTVDNYRLLSVLGTGSTSVVYLGQRLDDTHALVAVKVLASDATVQPSDYAAFRMRFMREARAAGRLRNEHILPVLNYGEFEGTTYMVMPVIVGGTLATRLAYQQGPLPLPEIADYLKQIADALDAAHRHGLVHRDVKPSNILLDEHGHVYLTDFGIARLFDSGDNALTREGPETLTRTGQVLGTPYYMAPEQIKGELVTPATDIYATGVVLFQMVTGQVPFHGDTPLAVALQHLQETPCAPSLLRDELPGPIEAVILRALAKDPKDRFATAGDMAEAFEAGLKSMDVAAPATSGGGTWPFASSFNARIPSAEDSSPDEVNRGDTERYAPLVGMRLGAYTVQRLVESSEVGAVFVAYREGYQTAYRLRVLNVPPVLSSDQRTVYQAQFLARARQLATLDAPTILPLVDFGNDQGVQYLVSPDPGGPSLTDVLAHSGRLDFSTVARYLDQIAAALTYAHEHGVLHLDLSADRVYVRDDGNVLVADFGVRAMLPHQEPDAISLVVESEACSPEQLLGKPTGEYTDVYALGAVLYQMLTGQPVFTGQTADDVAQQHLYSSVPPLRSRRGSAPAGLDNILARSMAKAPERRFRRPADLALAYQAVVQSATDASSQANAGTIVAARGMSGSMPVPTTLPLSPTVPVALDVPERDEATSRQAAITRQLPPTPPGESPPFVVEPAPAGGPRPRRGGGNAAWVALALVVLVGIVAGAYGIYNNRAQMRKQTSGSSAPVARTVGTAVFTDNPSAPAGHTDEVRLDNFSLPAPAAGTVYVAWLLSQATDRSQILGTMTKQGSQYSIDYATSNGTNLLAGPYDTVEITAEQGQSLRPDGTVVARATYPTGAFAHIGHLLVAWPGNAVNPPTPNHVGFVIGLVGQTSLLNTQAQALQAFAASNNRSGIICAAQSIIDISEGASGPSYQPLPGYCGSVGVTQTGDGYGILGGLGYTSGVLDHAALASTASDATPTVKLHAGHVKIAATDVNGWVTTVDHDAFWILHHPTDTSHVHEITTLSLNAYQGTDINGDEHVDPVPGEAGALTAYEHAQLMASLSLTHTP